MKQKLALPLGVLALMFAALVGFSVSIHSNNTVQAQTTTPTVSATHKEPDAETQDDAISSPKPSSSPVVNQKDDSNENDKTDSSISPEVEDGN